ncbi:MAG TPA: phosphoribosylanthranilate isomerase [Vicinamibacterales bacterium]|nr:phosphoribosylanthranilate isomerase [Vicinamibacterales bacterium]
MSVPLETCIGPASSRTMVKICGISRPEDALLAARLGAFAVGFVFWPRSPRVVDPTVARRIGEALPDGVTRVGVFVDQPIDEVVQVARGARLDAVQLHGHEPVAFARSVQDALGCLVIKAFGVGEGFSVDVLDEVPGDMLVLLDAHDPVKRGGTGRVIDWSIAAAAANRRQIMLSGGLTPANVTDAIAAVRPFAIDVSSGVEAAPGVKDPARLRALFAARHP